MYYEGASFPWDRRYFRVESTFRRSTLVYFHRAPARFFHQMEIPRKFEGTITYSLTRPGEQSDMYFTQKYASRE